MRLYQEQGVEIKNEKTGQEILDFIKERMRNVLKLKNIKPDIIEASVSSHAGDNFLDLYAKTILIHNIKIKELALMQLAHINEHQTFWIKLEKESQEDQMLFYLERKKKEFFMKKLMKLEKLLLLKMKIKTTKVC